MVCSVCIARVHCTTFSKAALRRVTFRQDSIEGFGRYIGYVDLAEWQPCSVLCEELVLCPSSRSSNSGWQDFLPGLLPRFGLMRARGSGRCRQSQQQAALLHAACRLFPAVLHGRSPQGRSRWVACWHCAILARCLSVDAAPSFEAFSDWPVDN
jgi:hypothetical protein